MAGADSDLTPVSQHSDIREHRGLTTRHIMPVPETQGRMAHSDLFTSGLADMERAREEFISSSNSMTKKMDEDMKSWRRGINDNDRCDRSHKKVSINFSRYIETVSE